MISFEKDVSDSLEGAIRQAKMIDAIGAIALTRTVATREPSHVSQSRPYGRVSSYRKEGNDNGRR